MDTQNLGLGPRVHLPVPVMAVTAAACAGWLLRYSLLGTCLSAAMGSFLFFLWWLEDASVWATCASNAVSLSVFCGSYLTQALADPRVPGMPRGFSAGAASCITAVISLGVCALVDHLWKHSVVAVGIVPIPFAVVNTIVLAFARVLGPCADWSPESWRIADEVSIPGLLHRVIARSPNGVPVSELGGVYWGDCGRSLEKDLRRCRLGSLGEMLSQNTVKFAVVRNRDGTPGSPDGPLRVRARTAPPEIAVSSRELMPTDPDGVEYHGDPASVRFKAAKYATVVYTLDGTRPTKDSTLFKERVTLRVDPGESTKLFQVRAVTVEAGLAPSIVASKAVRLVRKVPRKMR
eukprot:TRINITY_DN43799_c0_g1_i1.p1 TRINITY_DN43799_c0_g1~~TRINITY_DN43799_c0_g1_i1.p1  ORF type:complete len:348 (+),score=19.41 TRINITY_DN43799_c0_g1_i1:49-1092(+)